MGNAFGRNLGSHGGKVLLLNHVQGVEPSLCDHHTLEPAAGLLCLLHQQAVSLKLCHLGSPQFILDAASKIVKHTEADNRMVVSRGWEKGAMESSCLANIKLQLYKMSMFWRSAV